MHNPAGPPGGVLVYKALMRRAANLPDSLGALPHGWRMSDLTTLYTEEACRQSAAEAHLRYTTDREPGITRKARGKDFIYLAPSSERITSEPIIQRIHSLAIPPAYRDVWICPSANGHLQATGRDDRQRKQYRYHPKWAQMRSATKFHQLLEFANALPLIRKRVDKDMELRGLPKERVIAAIVRLMDKCHIRIGNVQYATENKTYGLTTLRKKHVHVEGDHIHFEFIGKSGKQWQRDISNKSIARIVHKCEEIAGHELFKYIDENKHRHPITSDDVNAYLQAISGKPFTAKDFRTWAATAEAVAQLGMTPPGQTKTENVRRLNDSIKSIAANLGHTPAICRKCYIHPKVVEAFHSGALYEWRNAHAHKDAHRMVYEFLAS